MAEYGFLKELKEEMAVLEEVQRKKNKLLDELKEEMKSDPFIVCKKFGNGRNYIFGTSPSEDLRNSLLRDLFLGQVPIYTTKDKWPYCKL